VKISVTIARTFGTLYVKFGRPSVPPEKLLRAVWLQALYSIRSERQLMEQLDYNILFRWFVGLGVDDAYYFFRHPGGQVASDYLHVPYVGGRTTLQLIGDGGSVGVPVSPFETIQDWPNSEDLPAIDLRQLAEGWA
jgi:hypothetical protein